MSVLVIKFINLQCSVGYDTFHWQQKLHQTDPCGFVCPVLFFCVVLLKGYKHQTVSKDGLNTSSRGFADSKGGLNMAHGLLTF